MKFTDRLYDVLAKDAEKKGRTIQLDRGAFGSWMWRAVSARTPDEQRKILTRSPEAKKIGVDLTIIPKEDLSPGGYIPETPHE